MSKKGIIRLKREGVTTITVKDLATKKYAKIKLTVTPEDTIYDLANKHAGDRRYFIRLNKAECKVYVLKRKYNEWTLLKKFPCCIGAPGTSTPSGIFHINGKGLYFTTESGSRCWYYSRIVGSILFHSQIYAPDSGPYRIVDGRMGVACSHGCVRLELKNAIWIYDTIPNGTTVYIS